MEISAGLSSKLADSVRKYREFEPKFRYISGQLAQALRLKTRITTNVAKHLRDSFVQMFFILNPCCTT